MEKNRLRSFRIYGIISFEASNENVYRIILPCKGKHLYQRIDINVCEMSVNPSLTACFNEVCISPLVFFIISDYYGLSYNLHEMDLI